MSFREMYVVVGMVALHATTKVGLAVASIGTSYTRAAAVFVAFFAGTGVVDAAGGSGLLTAMFWAYAMTKVAETVVSLCTTLRAVVGEIATLIRWIVTNEVSMAIYDAAKAFFRVLGNLLAVGNANAVDEDFDAAILAVKNGEVLFPFFVVVAVGVTCTLVKTVVFDLNLETYHESIPVLSAFSIVYIGKVVLGIIVFKCVAHRVVV